jgi:DNA-binding NarL/FixJ family response regulator
MTARTDFAQAALLLRRDEPGDRAAYREVADRARALADDLGMTRLAAELSELNVPMPETPSQPEPGVLSPRELDILRMIVDGRPDREIAQALFISPRTVGAHVTSILTKLDLPSRSAAAAYAVRHGLV